jgi:hypothetical protein
VTEKDKEQLDKMLQVIKESVINILDNSEVTEDILRREIYKKGLVYLGNNRDIQNIVDIRRFWFVAGIQTESEMIIKKGLYFYKP